MEKLSIKRPDDWHLHLRDGDMLKAVLPHTAQDFGRAIIMPNLVPPVTTTQQASAYRERIMAALPEGMNFTPLMVLYLTEQTDPADVRVGFEQGLITAVKLYPAGVTTNSASGVRDMEKVMPVLEAMAEIGMPLCVHGEVTDSDIDIFDREAVFIDRVLDPLGRRLPNLRVVFEHITTKQAVDYVSQASRALAATITTHHLMINRNAYLAGGIKPHYYCLPVAKREVHRKALVAAAISGDPRFFLGTDSAPHTDPNKLQECGCAGIFTAPNTMGCLAQVFEDEEALDRLEGFASVHGPAFYRLPVNAQEMVLVRSETPAIYPESIETKEGPVTVFDPMRPIYWKPQS